MRKILAILVAAASFAAPAAAQPYLFTISLLDSNSVSQPAYSFTIDSDPSPTVYDDSGFNYFQVENVTFSAAPGFSGTLPASADLLFFDQVNGGAFSTSDFTSISYFGTQLFDGTVDDPSFAIGTTDLYAPFGGPDPVGSISIASASAVPEPASWALMIGGVGAVGAVARRRGAALRLA